MTANVHESTGRFARYARHIEDLCRAFHIAVVPVPDPAMGGAGTQGRRKAIFISPVVDESTYAVALHELGHCLSPLGSVTNTEGSRMMRKHNVIDTLRDCLLQLEEERAAWDWAHHYALEWTPLMSQIERMSTRSYEEPARHMLGKEPPCR